MDERLELRAAQRSFGSDAGLFGVDLTVGAGEILALVGLNGAGKTTLMRAVLGMLRLSSGTVHIDGSAAAHMPHTAWAGVGHLVEHPFAYPELTTGANLELAARLHGIGSADVAGTVGAAVADFRLCRYEHIRARQLSLGNRQRLGLAAALQHHPSLIVLDEPTNALDPAGVLLLRDALLRRADAGAGILISSHHLDEVSRIADRICVLNHGQIIGVLEPDTTDLGRAFFDLVHNDDENRV